MSIFTVMFGIFVLVVLLAYLGKRQREREEMRKMDEEDEINSEYGYVQAEEVDAMIEAEAEAWRGDVHPDVDDDDDYLRR